jgi:hypothetical protein
VGVVSLMSFRRVAAISFGIAVVSAAGMAPAAEPKMIVFDASGLDVGDCGARHRHAGDAD